MEIAAALFLGLLVVAALVMGAQARAKAAGLRSMKHTAIAALADGAEARIVGVVREGDRSAHAPCANRAVALYATSISQWAFLGKRWGWRALMTARDQSNFVLEDSTGRVLVDTSSFELFAHSEELVEPVGEDDDSAVAREDIASIVEARGIAIPEGMLVKRMFRSHEQIVPFGAELAVVGRVTAATEDERARHRVSFKIVAREGSPVVLSDDEAMRAETM